MLLGVALLLAPVGGCAPEPGRVCSREIALVCAPDGRQFLNRCTAEAAGYCDDLRDGPCLTGSLAADDTGCGAGVRSERTLGCVPRPWADFVSCKNEKAQGACHDGYDPNPWVSEHCVVTCAV